jgi:hypothetical protein
MNLKEARNYLIKILIFEVVVFVCAALLWVFLASRATPFYTCLFIIGTVFAGIGTLFNFSAHNATFDDYVRRTWTGTSMKHDESWRRAWQDITVSYFQSSLFLWSGLIAVAISYFLYKP